MNYTEAQIRNLGVRSSQKWFKIHCHLIAVQAAPFPKLFVTDYYEIEDFAARLDFLAPIDIKGSWINPDEIMGIKLFNDKSKPIIEILKRFGVTLEGPKTLVFDKFIMLTLKIRLSNFKSRKGDILLEGIMDDAQLLKPHSTNSIIKDLYFNIQKRFNQTAYVNDSKYQKAVKDCKEKSATATAVTDSQTLKEEQELLLDSIPFDHFNSEEFEQSSIIDDEEMDEGASSQEIEQSPLSPYLNVAALNSLLAGRSFQVRPDEFFRLRAKIVAIHPKTMKDLISIGKDNSIKLKHMNFYLKDEDDEILKMTVSNNLSLLKFLLGDDITNNSSAQLLKLYYQSSEMDAKISKIYQKGKVQNFLVNWTNHWINHYDDTGVYLQSWDFFKIPKIDDLI